jgi:hypothetical protein
MLSELNGTEFNYTLRDQIYKVRLSENCYQVTAAGFSIEDKNGFGVNMDENILRYYPRNGENEGLSITRRNMLPVDIEIEEWGNNNRSWKIKSTGIYIFSVSGLNHGSSYRLAADGSIIQSYIADIQGNISFEYNCQAPVQLFIISL